MKKLFWGQGPCYTGEHPKVSAFKKGVVSSRKRKENLGVAFQKPRKHVFFVKERPKSAESPRSLGEDPGTSTSLFVGSSVPPRFHPLASRLTLRHRPKGFWGLASCGLLLLGFPKKNSVALRRCREVFQTKQRFRLGAFYNEILHECRLVGCGSKLRCPGEHPILAFTIDYQRMLLVHPKMRPVKGRYFAHLLFLVGGFISLFKKISVWARFCGVFPIRTLVSKLYKKAVSKKTAMTWHHPDMTPTVHFRPSNVRLSTASFCFSCIRCIIACQRIQRRREHCCW